MEDDQYVVFCFRRPKQRVTVKIKDIPVTDEEAMKLSEPDRKTDAIDASFAQQHDRVYQPGFSANLTAVFAPDGPDVFLKAYVQIACCRW